MSALPHSSIPIQNILRSATAACDLASLAHEVQQHYSASQLAAIASSAPPGEARAAAVVLGWIGAMEVTPALAQALHHRDPDVVRMAEGALWRIWFRAAGESAQAALFQCIQRRQRDRYPSPIRAISKIIREHATFAEAYNQRALAEYLNDSYESALKDYRRALHLNPLHFAARTGEGHCHVLLGRYAEALSCYHAALQIHPRMEGVRQLIRRINDVLGDARRPVVPARQRWMPAPLPIGSMLRRYPKS